MKTTLFFLVFSVISFSSQKTCLAQPPQWVTDLADEIFPFDISSITYWEEKQMIWYDVDDQPNQSDSVLVNTLFVKGVTTGGNYFVGKIPVTNEEVSAIGVGTTSDACEGQCGCQKCEFKTSEVGCQNCGDCVSQSGCTCWCKHTWTRL